VESRCWPWIGFGGAGMSARCIEDPAVPKALLGDHPLLADRAIARSLKPAAVLTGPARRDP